MDIQQGEVVRRLETLERKFESVAPYSVIQAEFESLDKEIQFLEKRINALELKINTLDVEKSNQKAKIDGIEDTIKWIVRLVMGAIILALVGTVLKGGFDV